MIWQFCPTLLDRAVSPPSPLLCYLQLPSLLHPVLPRGGRGKGDAFSGREAASVSCKLQPDSSPTATPAGAPVGLRPPSVSFLLSGLQPTHLRVSPGVGLSGVSGCRTGDPLCSYSCLTCTFKGRNTGVLLLCHDADATLIFVLF